MIINKDLQIKSYGKQDDVYLLADYGKGNLQEPKENWISNEITDRNIIVLNGNTVQNISNKSLYYNSKGYYFKADGKRYYINNFDNIERMITLNECR